MGYRIPGFLAVPSNTSGGDDLLLAVAEVRHSPPSSPSFFPPTAIRSLSPGAAL